MNDYYTYTARELRCNGQDCSFCVQINPSARSCVRRKGADAIDALQIKADNLYHLVRDLNLNEIVAQIGRDSLCAWLKSWQSAADAIYNRKPNGGTKCE